MLRIFGFSISASIFLASCTTINSLNVPEVTRDDYVSVLEILHAVQCELNESANAVRQDATTRRFADQLATVTLSLVVVETTNTGGKLTLVVPTSPGALTIGGGANPKATAKRTMEFDIKYDTSKPQPCQSKSSDELTLRPIAGGLGLREWLLEASAVLKQADEAPTRLKYAVSFDILQSNNGSVSFSRTSADNFKRTLEASAAETRKRTHTLTVLSVVKPTNTTARENEQLLKELDSAAENFLNRVFTDG